MVEMNMKKILYTLLFCLALPVSVAGQTTTPYKGNLAISFPDYVMAGDSVTFRADIDFSDLDLSTRQMVELAPVLRSTRTSYEQRFEPIVIAGQQRARILARAEAFGDYTWAVEPSEMIVLKRKTERIHEIAVTVRFEKWMRHSELVLVETCTACCNEQKEYAAGITSVTHAVTTPYSFPGPYQPVFRVDYTVPEVEPIKVMSNTFSARLTFQSGKSNLLQDFGNNAQVLAEVDRIIESMRTDSLLTVKSIVVKGYASPDGYMGDNFRLSQNRAQAFVSHLIRRNTNLSRLITSQGVGEDWEGLRQAVETSNLNDRDRVVEAIDGISDIARRKTTIKKLSGGRTWRMLSDEFFPVLRRNEYTIQYEVRGFNAEEAKTYVWSRPQLLSLNELFMAARLYAPTSQEYKDIFYIASRMYPDSEISQFNAGAMEIENGAYDMAISRLIRMETPKAWNNLGVAYWHKADYKRAREYFVKAREAGLKNAEANLNEYTLWLEDKDE